MDIIFTKILPYDLRRSSFDYVCSILDQTVDPPSLAPHQLRLQTDIVYHSILGRAIDCMQYEQGKTYKAQSELNEVAFTLADACTEQEWLSLGSKKVREVFIHKFLDDSLSISRVTLFNQVHGLLSNILSNARSTTLVSHSFRMKLYEAYIFTQGRIVDVPELIREYIVVDKKTFEFGQSFTATEADLQFLKV